MSFWYGWDTPLIMLNLLLWLSLMVVNPNKAKWGLLLLQWAVTAGAVLLTWYDYSYYVEAPRAPVHVLLLMLPVMLATIVIALESNGWVSRRVWTRTVLEWGLVLLLVDVVFYLFPYGYIRVMDYVVLGGALFLSLILLSVKNAAFHRDKATHLRRREEGAESTEEGFESSGEGFEGPESFGRSEGKSSEEGIEGLRKRLESYEAALQASEKRLEGYESGLQNSEENLEHPEQFDPGYTRDHREPEYTRDPGYTGNPRHTKEDRRELKNNTRSASPQGKGRAFVSFLLSILLVAGSVVLYGAGAVVTNANFSFQRETPVNSERYPVEAGYVLHEGATIYYEVRGEGQPLLLIPGGGGDAGFYTNVVDLLADEYQVITYDRRGNSRSEWDAPHHVEISQQARDAVAVLKTVKAENVNVFGNSSGAIVAMELATQYPEMLDTVIVHEPPVVRVLPDSSKWKSFFAGIHDTSARLGSEAGNIKFTFSVGVPLSAFFHIPGDFQDRNAHNTDILIQEEMPVFVQYQPNLQKLQRNRVDVIFAAGELSLHKQKFFARTAEVLSDEWDQELALFPGHHLSYFDDAKAWSDALKAALKTELE